MNMNDKYNNSMTINRIYAIFLIFISVNLLSAKVRLPAIISDNMVLQQQAKVCMWGETKPNNYVKISPSWTNKSVKIRSDKNGYWDVKLHTPKAGGPYIIVFDDGELLKIENILIGEVWLCAGQSNMEMPIKGINGQPVFNSTSIISNAVSDIPIRMFSVKKEFSRKKQNDVTGVWRNHDSESVANFSATAYFFGRQLYNSLRVPIGLINTSWGGSKIESWLPYEIIKLFPEIALSHLSGNDNIKRHQHLASLLYNSMLYPLHRISIKGVIWYQGESNYDNPDLYENLMVNFVDHLRLLFKNDKMPFYYAQIAPYAYNDSNGIKSAEFRQSQLRCESLIPYSGMAVLIDIGEEFCLHPSRKDIVGERLAYLALNKSYGKYIPALFPKFESKKIESDKIILSFSNVGQGLISFGKQLENFEIAGEDKKIVKAFATIQRDKVKVWNNLVKNPIAVRYCYKNFAIGDLFGVNGLPVSSFKTDF